MDDERWGGNPLSILGASISFDRKPPIDELVSDPREKVGLGASGFIFEKGPQR